MRMTRLSLAALACLSAAASASAAPVDIALYDFEGVSGLASKDTDGNTGASTLSSAVSGSFSGNTGQGVLGLEVHTQQTDRRAGESLAFNGTTVSGSALAGRFFDIDRTDTQDATPAQTYALNNNNYISFTLTPGANVEIDLTALDFGYDRTNGGATKTFWLMTDSAGFTVGNEIGIGAITADGTVNMDLSSAANITAVTEFRLYMFIDVSDGSNQNHGFAIDDLTLSAEVSVVPEPSSLALLGLGGLLIGTRRRG